jgi:hypothetical protein
VLDGRRHPDLGHQAGEQTQIFLQSKKKRSYFRTLLF